MSVGNRTFSRSPRSVRMNRDRKDDDLEKDSDLDVCWAKAVGIVVLINARARFQFTLFRAGLFQYLVVGINTTHRVNVRGASVFLCFRSHRCNVLQKTGEKTVEGRGGGEGRLVIEKSGRLRGGCALFPPLSPLASDSDVITARWFVCSFADLPFSIWNNSAYSAHDPRLSSVE